MEKKMYLPTEENLYEIQKIKNNNEFNEVNIYAYLILKTIEKVLVDRANGIPFCEMDDYILNLRDVIHGICWVYPEEIKNFGRAKQDDDLCIGLLDKEQDSSIYNLDHLAKFDISEPLNIQYYSLVIGKTLKILNEKLTNNPEYRYEYKDSNLLNSIFTVDFEKFDNLSFDSFNKLMKIDASYIFGYNPRSDAGLHFDKDEKIVMHREALFFQEGIREMLKRYDLSQFIGYDYQEIDITKTSDERIKKLKRFLSK